MSKKIESSFFLCKLREGAGPLALKGTGVSMPDEGCLTDQKPDLGELGRGFMETSFLGIQKEHSTMRKADTDSQEKCWKYPALYSLGITWLQPIHGNPLWHSTLQKCFPFVPVNKTREHGQKKERNNCLLSPIQLPTEPIWKKRIQLSFPAGCQHHG